MAGARSTAESPVSTRPVVGDDHADPPTELQERGPQADIPTRHTGERRPPRSTGAAFVPGTVLGAYRLVRLLGEGGMGQVFLAEHVRLERRVALKLLRPKLARDRDLVRRFFNEARAVTRIRHPNIVEITDFVEDEQGRSYFIMELLTGQTLGTLVAGEGAMPLGQVVQIARQICDALWAVHQEGFVHRDLKPENVFLAARDPEPAQVKLLDFGLVKGGKTTSSAPPMTNPELVVGTPGYMSPEQIRGSGELDRRSDIYALGVLLYEMVTGVRPLVGTTIGDQLVKTVTMMPATPGDMRPEGDLPQPFDELIMRCLAKDPDDRPQSAREIALELDQIAREFFPPLSASEADPAPDPSTSSRRKRRRRAWLVPALIGLGVVGLALLMVLIFGRQEPPAPAPAVARTEAGRQGVIARLAQVWGEVHHRQRGETGWGAAERGQGLVHHDWIRTGKGARALVRFDAGGHLEIQEQSEVLIEAPRRGGDGAGPLVAAVAQVKRGTVMALVRPGAPMRITTPDGKTALVTNRGKETVSFRMRARGDGRLEMAVLKGQARVQAGGGAVDLDASQVVDLERGQLGQRGALMRYPELLAPAVDAWLPGKTALTLRWTAVDGARGYRVQLSHFMGFDDKLLDQVVETPSAWLSRLVPETYFWRVATVNASGQEGEFGFTRRFRIITRAATQVDALLTPEDDTVVQYIHKPRPVTFRWSGTGSEYQIRISRRPALDRALVVKKSLKHTSIRIPALKPGIYYWGVVAIDRQGRKRPLFQKARRLVIVQRTRPRVHLPAIEWK